MNRDDRKRMTRVVQSFDRVIRMAHDEFVK